MRELIRRADANDIVVGIQVHDGWTKMKFAGHPFNEGQWYDVQRLRAFQMHFLDFFKARATRPLIINDDDHIRGESKANILSHHTPRWDNLAPPQVFVDHYRREFDTTPVTPPFERDAVLHLKGMGDVQ